MKHFQSFFALLFALLIAACSSNAESVQINTDKAGQPALWKVTGTTPEQKGAAYLFGTIHMLPKDVRWQTAALNSALAASDRLVIEVIGLEDVAKNAKIFAKLAISGDQPKIENRVMPSLRDDLDKAVDKANIPELALNRMESWAVALSLATARTDSLGLSSSEGVEQKLSAIFSRAKKPISGLETIEQQLGYFDRLPEAAQRAMLASVIEESDNARIAFEELFNAWLSGDVNKLAELTEGGILEKPVIRDKILVARNLDWAEQLDTQLKQSGTAFVAVGAAHLVGGDAVQKMLATRGYKIERLQ